jgi:ribose transport system ATP-binding protein
MGAGRTELLECIYGLHPNYSEGDMSVSGEACTFKSPAEAINAGIGLVPEDRKNDGLVLDLSVKTNISLASLKNLESYGLLNSGKEKLLADSYIDSLSIKTPSSAQKAGNLSGGNQQKIILAKWMATNPKVLLLDEPTRGIDINAKNEIYKLITKLASKGLGIIMVSSELPEILAISDRIMVMSEGQQTAEFNANEASEEKIMQAAIPQTN